MGRLGDLERCAVQPVDDYDYDYDHDHDHVYAHRDRDRDRLFELGTEA